MDNDSAGGLTPEQADLIYNILEELVGASPRRRAEFVHQQTTSHVSEYRFMGSLGFGGKFWRNTMCLPDGSWGEGWYVNTYKEAETPAASAMIHEANAALMGLRMVYA